MSNNDLNLLLNMFTKNGKPDIAKINQAKSALSESDLKRFDQLVNNKEEREKLFNSPEVQKLLLALSKGQL